MAARNPTDYTRWVDQNALSPGEPVLASTIDNVFDDQEYAILAPRLIVSDCFWEHEETAAGYTEYRTYWALGRDDGGATANNHDCYFRAYVVADASTTGYVKVTTSQAADSAEVSFTNTTLAWCTKSAAFDGRSNTVESFQVDVRVSSGYSVYLYGIAIWTE